MNNSNNMPKGIPNNGINKGWFKKGSQVNLDRKCSEKTIEKIKEHRKGKCMGDENPSKRPEVREKIRQSKLDKKRSPETIQKMKKRKKLFGKDNPNWKGDKCITPENKRIRMSIDFRLWREAVFARDNWTCQKTGIRGGILHPHHIKDFSNYPELRFAIDNGITLSEKAHREFHKKYGYNNNREQLTEFLNI